MSSSEDEEEPVLALQPGDHTPYGRVQCRLGRGTFATVWMVRTDGGGYAAVNSVLRTPVVHRDKMDSFWLAETLKYLHLLFGADEDLPLSKWVLNTEAHPLPIRREFFV